MFKKKVIPRATYRVQLDKEFNFKGAEKLIPYLCELGVSHLYLSPIFKARLGSLHGYDVCDYTEINPEIGTEKDLADLVSALKRHKMGLVLDIVPNHMCISGKENKWWWDVLEKGKSSRYSNYFDIDWAHPNPEFAGKVMLPVLEKELELTLASREIKINYEAESFVIEFKDQVFPVNSKSIPTDLGVEKSELADKINNSPEILKAVLLGQNYVLFRYRMGEDELNYRCFFDITFLARLRIEDEKVFKESHRKLREWYKKGYFDGLRIDHIDGLSDPEQYLKLLNKMFPKTWIVVEKLLVREEELSKSWPIDGTVGYDFLNRSSGLMINTKNETAVTKIYDDFISDHKSYEEVFIESRGTALKDHLFSDLCYITRLLSLICKNNSRWCKYSEQEIKKAVFYLAVSFEVRRTYKGTDPLSKTDSKVFAAAKEKAQKTFGDDEAGIYELIEEVFNKLSGSNLEFAFTSHFEQLTAAIMVKGVEDTAFYRYNRLVALNDLGGDRGDFGISKEKFFELNKNSQKNWPNSLLASTTHDTKRSEDTRARASVLSEIPEDWQKAIYEWLGLSNKFKSSDFSNKNIEYMLFQNLIATWPISKERFSAYMLKAARENKESTGWKAPNLQFEKAMQSFLDSMFSNQELLNSIDAFTEKIFGAGMINSLGQVLLKLTSPGVPDIYRGTEVLDFSLVDPDNRREVNFDKIVGKFEELQKMNLKEIWRNEKDGLPKLFVTWKVLQLRKKYPECFVRGNFSEIKVEGSDKENAISFIRSDKIITVVPLLTLSLKNAYQDTNIILPKGQWIDQFSGQEFTGSVCLQNIFSQFPVALLLKK